MGCLSIVGLILGIIDLTKKDGRKKGLSIAAVAISVVALIASIALTASVSSGNKDKKVLESTNAVTESSGEASEAGHSADEDETPVQEKKQSLNQGNLGLLTDNGL